MPALVSKVSAAPHEAGHGPENLLTNEADFYTPTEVAGRYEVIQEFARAQKIDKVLLKEQCAFSQRIEAFRIYVRLNGRERLVYEARPLAFAGLPSCLSPSKRMVFVWRSRSAAESPISGNCKPIR